MKNLIVAFLLTTACYCSLWAQPVSYFNITPFGSLRSWTNTGTATGIATSLSATGKKEVDNIGILWWEARDIRQVEIEYAPGAPGNGHEPVLEYWQSTWPQEPPQMPSVEDADDDPWNGHWIAAATEVSSNGKKTLYSFKPLTTAENKNAAFLPGSITYRRTLKLRLRYPGPCPAIRNIAVYACSKQIEKKIRLQLPDATHVSATAFNGSIKQLKNAGKSLLLSVIAAEPLLPGSNDETIVTIHAPSGSFSFSLSDLDHGPIYIPDRQAFITHAADTTRFDASRIIKGQTILERIPSEPEQTYERARKEIPALDPWQNQYGTRMYMPLAADASWQKFGVEWGGNFFQDKQLTKAQGREQERCKWNGAALRWEFGVGDTAAIGAPQPGLSMNFLDNYLPVVSGLWRKDGLICRQEFFTTLLSGPLSPLDETRDEQTPAILMVKMIISNPSTTEKQTTVFTQANQAVDDLTLKNGFLFDRQATGDFIRCYISSPDKSVHAALIPGKDGKAHLLGQSMTIPANSSIELNFYFPFVGDLDAQQAQPIAALSYDAEKTRVTDYWRRTVSENIPFLTPERKFNEMSRAVIPHIHMSATRDPKSHLFMIPASSIVYGVYANESCFQSLLLDKIGDFKTAAEYLKTFVTLQGSKKLPGDFTGDQKEVYYGVRVDSVYDQTWNGYNMHHGTTLWALASHYLYSKDKDWLDRNIGSMKRAADWLIQQRGNSRQGETPSTSDHYGLLPAGILEDPEDWQYWFATNAYGYLGMTTLAKAMQQAGLPEAGKYAAEAQSFRDDIRRCIFRASEQAPVIKLRNGAYVPFVPVRAYQRFRYFGSKKSAYYERYNTTIRPNLRLSATREVLYGPLTLLKTGIIEPNEPIAQAILQDWEDNITMSTSLNLNTHGWVDDDYWFSRGGMVFQANLQNPASVYLSRGETPAAIRSLYNSFVACLYPDVNVFTEEYRMWEHGSGPFYKVPDEARSVQSMAEMLVFEKDNELLLAAGTPRRWLEPGEKIELFKYYTSKGRLSYRLQAGLDGNTVTAEVDLSDIKSGPVTLFIHPPFGKKIRSVTINGENAQHVDAEKESIQLPTGKKLSIQLHY